MFFTPDKGEEFILLHHGHGLRRFRRWGELVGVSGHPIRHRLMHDLQLPSNLAKRQPVHIQLNRPSPHPLLIAITFWLGGVFVSADLALITLTARRMPSRFHLFLTTVTFWTDWHALLFTSSPLF